VASCLGCYGITEKYIGYNAFQLIDTAAALGFEVLSITNHDTVTYSTYLRDYARERGLLLIPGIEITHQGTHIVAYNIPKQLERIRTIEDIYKMKCSSSMFIAPHPFFPMGRSLGKKFYTWHHIFDAVEYSHFYTESFNCNARATREAEAYGLPMIGTSDSHMLSQLNSTYTLIDAEKETESVFEAIKRGDVHIVTRPLALSELISIAWKLSVKHAMHKTGAACFSRMSQLLKTFGVPAVSGADE